MEHLYNLPFRAPWAKDEVISSEHVLGTDRRADTYVVIDRTDACYQG